MSKAHCTLSLTHFSSQTISLVFLIFLIFFKISLVALLQYSIYTRSFFGPGEKSHCSSPTLQPCTNLCISAATCSEPQRSEILGQFASTAGSTVQFGSFLPFSKQLVLFSSKYGEIDESLAAVTLPTTRFPCHPRLFSYCLSGGGVDIVIFCIPAEQ